MRLLSICLADRKMLNDLINNELLPRTVGCYDKKYYWHECDKKQKDDSLYLPYIICSANNSEDEEIKEKFIKSADYHFKYAVAKLFDLEWCIYSYNCEKKEVILIPTINFVYSLNNGNRIVDISKILYDERKNVENSAEGRMYLMNRALLNAGYAGFVNESVFSVLIRDTQKNNIGNDCIKLPETIDIINDDDNGFKELTFSLGINNEVEKKINDKNDSYVKSAMLLIAEPFNTSYNEHYRYVIEIPGYMPFKVDNDICLYYFGNKYFVEYPGNRVLMNTPLDIRSELVDMKKHFVFGRLNESLKSDKDKDNGTQYFAEEAEMIAKNSDAIKTATDQNEIPKYPVYVNSNLPAKERFERHIEIIGKMDEYIENENVSVILQNINDKLKTISELLWVENVNLNRRQEKLIEKLLPTLEKLCRIYDVLEEDGSERVNGKMSEIENSIAKLNDYLNKHIKSIYTNIDRTITAEISTMQAFFKTDGLSGNDELENYFETNDWEI